MSFSQLTQPVEADLAAVNETLSRDLSSDVLAITEIAGHLIHSGGKRIRPLVVLLAARAAGYTGTEHVDAGAIVELIHTATLLHDDVVDASKTRRHQLTANEIWGNAKTILTGDYLYSRAFQRMTHLDCSDRVLPMIADATTIIAEGEVLQLSNRHNVALDKTTYFQIIEAKTAKLFEVSAAMGGYLAQVGDAQVSALKTYGCQLGIAFQLMDDLMDYTADADALGKDLGDDLAEGKLTLPLILALQSAPEAEAAAIRLAVQDGRRDALAMIKDCINRSGALTDTQKAAMDAATEATSALNALPQSPYRETLRELVNFAVQRSY